MTPQEFIAKWERVNLTERSAAQQHFLDLCELFDHPKPAEADPTGESFTFEKGAAKHGGGDGWADVWKKGFFGWEYKGKHKDLDAAYDQLLRYREALENPPLLVVCDMDRLVIHTNFTATPAKNYEIALADLGTVRNLEILRCLFHDPEKLRPGITSEAITAEAAGHLAEIAESMRRRDLDPAAVAHFLDRIVFCLFAEDVGLLPESMFSRIVAKSSRDPKRFAKLIGQLFESMAHGGDFGMDTIHYFNGNLFADSSVLELTQEEIDRILAATKLDWSAVDPSIFGTLFERGMDPSKRSQLGAHYTSRQDIETLVEPVVMQPLRREWNDVRQRVEKLLAAGKKEGDGSAKGKPAVSKSRRQAEKLLSDFIGRLQQIRVLDPACGSGNFLYVTLQKLKDLEKEVCVYAAKVGVAFFPLVGPWQLYGIEVSPYAFDLAQMTIWIGWLQWIRANGYGHPSEPILRPLDTFRCMDAILDLSDPENPKEPDWPAADFIIGNPPFLGGNKIRAELGDKYVESLFALYKGRLPAFADLCCYWFEKARWQISQDHCNRAGLLATQGIRGGANREVLNHIKGTGDIFFAVSDQDWILDGASVHVSIVGFDGGNERSRQLDGASVDSINSNLTSQIDTTQAKALLSNKNICFMGASKKASFDVTDAQAMEFLLSPNPDGRPNSDVVRPWANGLEITRRPQRLWIIDFGNAMPEMEASKYESPFEYARKVVKPERMERREKRIAEMWWRFARPRVEMRTAVRGLGRYLVTPTVSKHRLFVWLQDVFVPDQQLLVFASDQDFVMGILQSRPHEIWARLQGTQVRERESGFRYTPTTCFETFAYPTATDTQRETIATSAKDLDSLRTQWLYPPEWTREEVFEFPGSISGPWARYVHQPDSRGIGTVRYPRLVPKDEDSAKHLAKRTLTNLYNQRPTWLDLAYKKLDQAVFAAYGWDPGMSDQAILEALMKLNL
jgi:type II restriction/modification system DNA methylase subunit YeeA